MRKSSVSMAYEKGWDKALCKMPRVACVMGLDEWPCVYFHFHAAKRVVPQSLVFVS